MPEKSTKCPIDKEVKKSVVDYKSELSALRKKTLNINRSVCNLDEVISSIQASSRLRIEKLIHLRNSAVKVRSSYRK